MLQTFAALFIGLAGCFNLAKEESDNILLNVECERELFTVSAVEYTTENMCSAVGELTSLTPSSIDQTKLKSYWYA